MKIEEKIAENYLKSLGFKDVIFEPDGNIPPDFSIDGRIAVEVRRLNQQSFMKDEALGLEEYRMPLFRLIESCLKNFDSQYRGHSYWVSISFHRPTGNINKKAIIKALSEFLSKPRRLPYHIELTDNIKFCIWSRQAVEGKVFRFAGGTDRESGGFVLSEFKQNFDYCVKEKSEKIKPYYEKYTLWWLVLVDTIAYGFDEDEEKEIKLMITMNSLFDKAIVLDGIEGKNILEINKDI